MSQFETNIINLYQDKGKTWLKSLDQLKNTAAQNYGLSNIKEIKNLTYNYVLSATQGSRQVILKIGFDTKLEEEAVKAYENYGGVKLLFSKDNILLLERILPGYSLTSLFPTEEIEGLRIFSNLVNTLHQAPIPENHSFPYLKDWLKILDNNYPQIELPHLVKARDLRDQLLSMTNKDVLLHGDLHHNNIFKSNDSWVAIDPKGVIGCNLYDIAVFIRNPIPDLLKHPNPHTTINNRIEFFAKNFNLNEELIRKWCFVQSVLSIVWAIEDRGDESYFKKFLTMLDI